MTTLPELIATLESDLKQAEQTRDRSLRAMKAVTDAARRQGRRTLTAVEDNEAERALSRFEAAKKEIQALGVKLKSAREAQAAEDEMAATAHISVREPHNTAQRPSYDRVARIGSEPRTYERHSDPHGRQFLSDVVRGAMYADPTAQSRLARYQQEEQVERGSLLARAVGTSAFSGLVVPAYLTDLYAPGVSSARPFADNCNIHPLPESGMTVEISRITTTSSVDVQATQNTAVAEQNMDDTLLSLPVLTVAGQQTLSRQAVERGTAIEEVTMDDLLRRYHSRLDYKLINDATVGLAAVAATTTYTSASPTAAELHPLIMRAASGVETVLLDQGPVDLVVMHIRRFRWLAGRVESALPFIGTSDVPPTKGGLILTTEYGPAVRALLSSGEKVCVDSNVPTTVSTNQDEVYVLASRECHLWEMPSSPVFLRAEVVASLGITLVAYGYSAYTMGGRYGTGATAKIGGTGLVNPYV